MQSRHAFTVPVDSGIITTKGYLACFFFFKYSLTHNAVHVTFVFCLLRRLLGLGPILDRVLEFDTLKNSLEDWCVQQQELIEQLPPLEVTEEMLLPQQTECSALLDDIVVRSESIQKLQAIATQCFRDTEVCTVHTKKINSRL